MIEYTVKDYGDGGKSWWVNGERHREDGPAVERPNGHKEWWFNGERHRLDGPATEFADGSKQWWVNDKLHREDGPAVELGDGSKEWWFNGERHREDGPAIERADGTKQWWVNGKKVTEGDVMAKQGCDSSIVEVESGDNVSYTPHGGPSSYYDMPFQDWVTLNDQMEYLAQNKWGIHSIHLKDIFKGLGRWGEKGGTTPLYDTRKGIYYFCRVMRMMVGVEQLRDYLNSLLEDPQFK